VSIEQVVALVDGPFCYSRALAPEIRRELSSRPGCEELPFVRGRTVIAEREARPIVLGHPNYLGVFEPPHDGPTILLTGRWSNLRPATPGASVVAMEPAIGRAAADRSMDDARTLLKRLRQIRGAQPAWKPQSPVLIMLLPRGVALFAEPQVIDTAGLSYPELPGGIRIEVVGDVSGADVTRYAATLERAIIQEA
jgi:hypothetical protein